MAGADRVTRLALLHVIGRRADPGVDDVLTAALADPGTRATAAYLLGRPGFKGYPGRPRDVDAVRAALWPHVDDDTTLDDPFARRDIRAGDAALAAWIRLTGPGRFRIPDRTTADLIGYALPVLDDALRRDLLGQARDAHDAPP